MCPKLFTIWIIKKYELQLGIWRFGFMVGSRKLREIEPNNTRIRATDLPKISWGAKTFLFPPPSVRKVFRLNIPLLDNDGRFLKPLSGSLLVWKFWKKRYMTVSWESGPDICRILPDIWQFLYLYFYKYLFICNFGITNIWAIIFTKSAIILTKSEIFLAKLSIFVIVWRLLDYLWKNIKWIV